MPVIIYQFKIIASLLKLFTNFRFSSIMMVSGLFFLYLPLLLLVILSFNPSPISFNWNEFSIKWYIELFHDKILLTALWTSLKIACYTASMSVFLGLLTSISLIKLKAGTLFKSLVTAPLVLPDVIASVSLLLLFISMMEIIGWPAELGITTVWIAHSTMATAYVAVLIGARLREINPELEEAALDLGATPFKTFFYITIPQIMPALFSGWLLGFTLSLDDLVLASFVSGAEINTLTMIVFSASRFGMSPKINALSALIILLVSLCAWISWYRISHTKTKNH